MGLTTHQLGRIGETECAKHIMIGSRGLVATFTPEIDDEQRDIEAHLRDEVSPGIAIQCKVSSRLIRPKRAYRLPIRWKTPKRAVFSHKRFWYFLAHFDVKTRMFTDPVFLVPSDVIAFANRRNLDGSAIFELDASMDPRSRDHWSPYRLPARELGHRVLEIIRELNSRQVRCSGLAAA